MLQPLQLEAVSQRYPEEIAEVRAFLGSAGLVVGSREALAETAARLQVDRGFRRDLTSYLWAAQHQAHGTMSPAQLLGVVAVAAAGTDLAAEAAEADAHQLLRFVMEARRALDAVPGTAHAVTTPLRTYAAPVSVPTALGRADASSPDPFGAMEEQPDRRKLYAAMAAVLSLLLFVVVGLLWHRSSSAGSATSTTAAVVQPAPPRVSSPVVVSTVEPPVIHTAPAARSSARERASSLKPAAKAAVRPPSSRPLAAAPVTRPASPRAPAVAATRPASAPSAAAPVPADGLGPEDTEAIRLLRRPGDPKYIPDVAAAINGPFVHATSLGIMASHVTYGPSPAYPRAAAAAHVQGEVKVEAEVSQDGDVTSARVISGPPLLRDAATAAIQQWKYRPYLADGNKPVSVNATVLMDFQLP